jgi:formiminotetrahydrofolate cyclodeaminase
MDVEGLRTFCLELSSDRPSPGGGAASAAAGAMAASLLIMACGITSRSKKHAMDVPKLDSLKAELTKARDELLALVTTDASAFDAVAEASRRARKADSEENRKAYQDALRLAVDAPARTADSCIEVVMSSVEVAKLQVLSASSDSEVGVLLARAAFEGACANVEINLREMTDTGFVTRMRAEIPAKRAEFDDLARKALTLLERPA